MERDLSDLDERFTPFYESGERIEVEWEEGYEVNIGYTRENGRFSRFYVGRSTGWRPIYLMILRRDSTGGEGILSSAVRSVRGVGIYR